MVGERKAYFPLRSAPGKTAYSRRHLLWNDCGAGQYNPHLAKNLEGDDPQKVSSVGMVLTRPSLIFGALTRVDEMTTVARMLQNQAHAAFKSNPKLDFFITQLDRDQAIALAEEGEAYDALQPAITHVDVDFIKEPQWAIVSRETLRAGRSGRTALLVPIDAGRPLTLDYARALWPVMIAAHFEGYSLVEFLVAFPRYQTELGLEHGSGGYRLPSISGFPIPAA